MDKQAAEGEKAVPPAYPLGETAPRIRLRRHASSDQGQWFRLMAQVAPVLFWTTDIDGQIVFVNRWFERFFGLSVDEVNSEDSWRRIIHEDDYADFVEAYRECAVARCPLEKQCRVRRADGEWRWVSTHAAPYFSETGEFGGFVGCSPDITEQVERDRRIQEADRHKDEFMAMLSHELRNPLSAISNAVRFLQGSGPFTPRVEGALALLGRQTQHLSRLVGDLADTQSIANGTLALKRAVLPLQECVSAALEAVMPAIEQQKQKVVLNLPSEPVRVAGDGTRLTQVFVNLLGNASKFSPEQGRIFVRMQALDDAVRVSVRDHGTGIARGEQQRIFDLFVRAESPDGLATTGWGVGLWVAKKLVEQHDGHISIDSDGAGMGSEFTVTLPRLGAE